MSTNQISCLGFFRQGDALNQLLFADELPEETLQVAHLGQKPAAFEPLKTHTSWIQLAGVMFGGSKFIQDPGVHTLCFFFFFA